MVRRPDHEKTDPQIPNCLVTETFTRYYLAERIGGSPADMGWESQCVVLVPEGDLRSLDLAPADKQVVRALEDSVQP